MVTFIASEECGAIISKKLGALKSSLMSFASSTATTFKIARALSENRVKIQMNVMVQRIYKVQRSQGNTEKYFFQ